MSAYFMSEDGKQVGPFTVEELAEREIDPSSLVWQKGMSQWTPARQIPELATLFPPPLPPTVARTTPRTPAPITAESMMKEWLRAKMAGVERYSAIVLVAALVGGALVRELLAPDREPWKIPRTTAQAPLREGVIGGLYVGVVALAVVFLLTGLRTGTRVPPSTLQGDRMTLRVMQGIVSLLVLLIGVVFMYLLWQHTVPRMPDNLRW
jgi:hypothetical protein